jgi:hypothetical protein
MLVESPNSEKQEKLLVQCASCILQKVPRKNDFYYENFVPAKPSVAIVDFNTLLASDANL